MHIPGEPLVTEDTLVGWAFTWQLLAWTDHHLHCPPQNHRFGVESHTYSMGPNDFRNCMVFVTPDDASVAKFNSWTASEASCIAVPHNFGSQQCMQIITPNTAAVLCLRQLHHLIRHT